VHLKGSIAAYKGTFGEFPTGSSAEIASALLGRNTSHVPVLTRSNALVDPWGTAFRITIVGDNVEVRSAGPNRTFGDADDIDVRIF